MPDGTLLLGFIAAALVVLLIPGPGVVYIVARSVSQGYRAGLASVVGLSAGALVHVAAATVGLSAILLTSAMAFAVVKAIGAGYLIYLGLRALFAARSSTDSATQITYKSMYRLFADGVVISVFNPKIALFFLAFLPQFVDPDAGPLPQQILLLGLLYVALALITDSGYALLAGKMREWLTDRVMLSPRLHYVTGGIYLGLGLTLALTGRRN